MTELILAFIAFEAYRAGFAAAAALHVELG